MFYPSAARPSFSLKRPAAFRPLLTKGLALSGKSRYQKRILMLSNRKDIVKQNIQGFQRYLFSQAIDVRRGQFAGNHRAYQRASLLRQLGHLYPIRSPSPFAADGPALAEESHLGVK